MLGHKNLSFDDWLEHTVKDKNPADEIAIYCLARMYSRHVVIYTSSYCWSTLMRHFMYNEQEIHKHCDIRLILLGKFKYAHVRPIRLPFTTIPKPFPTNVKTEDVKPKIKDEPKGQRHRSKEGNVVNKITYRGQHLASKAINPNISSSNIINNYSHVHNTRPTNSQPTKRSSKKPLHESRWVIDYAMLNDGIDSDRSPSPKCKRYQKIRPQVSGPSVTHASPHAQSMTKK